MGADQTSSLMKKATELCPVTGDDQMSKLDKQDQSVSNIRPEARLHGNALRVLVVDCALNVVSNEYSIDCERHARRKQKVTSGLDYVRRLAASYKAVQEKNT